MGGIQHNPRCAIFREPPSLRDASDCNCGAIPPLPITDAITQHLSSLNIDEVQHWLLWRVGRKVGRTIYAQMGPEPSDDDVLIGMMDGPRLAEEAVNAHNAVLRYVQHPDFGKGP